MLPAYLVSLDLPALAVDYPWDTTIFNRFWASNDEDSPQLAAALGLISVKAAWALGVACSEWVVARVDGHTDTTDALLRVEAAWAAASDRRYASLPRPAPSPPSSPAHFASPLRLAMKFLSHGFDVYQGEGFGVRSGTQALAMLVEHVARQQPAFSPWLSESLRRAHRHFPRMNGPVEQEPAIPKDFFEPDFVWLEGSAQESLDRFVGTLDPSRNPYLNSPAEIRAAGSPEDS